jgi:uncharacterized protein YycO
VLLLLTTLLAKPAAKSQKVNVEAQPGDLLLFTRARGLNRTITWLTRSRYYHVGIYVGNNHVVEARPRGVVRRDLNGPDGDKSFVVIPSPINGDQRKAALRWAEAQVGDPYDPVSAFVIILDQLFGCSIPYATNSRFSCGEYVTQAFAHAGADLFPSREPSTVVPADFEQFLPENENAANVV